jgi:hypothetical protein
VETKRTAVYALKIPEIMSLKESYNIKGLLPDHYVPHKKIIVSGYSAVPIYLSFILQQQQFLFRQ